MRELTPDTKIRITLYPDFEEIFIKDQLLIEDAQKYNVGDISKKTGLQKCMVNGRIVWLLPIQNQNFHNGRIAPNDLNTLLKSCKKARASTNYYPKAPTVNEAQKCYNDMKQDWKRNPVKSPFFNGAKIRLDKNSDYHFTHKKGGVPRDPKDIIRRGYLLPYVRDILERTGKPAEHTIENKNESYSIAGKANIKGVDKGIKIIISRHTDGKYFYFSVMDIQLI